MKTNQAYKKQVKLLLSVLPEVAKEKCFALHGGTAINLFMRDMPRLSVDIDLTYIPLEERSLSLQNISEALSRIKERVESIFPQLTVVHQEDKSKIIISNNEATIKLEVNLTKRGSYLQPEELLLCDKAQSEFDAFCMISVVPVGQLYGGKICAALDRQHPRDLFDVRDMLSKEGFSEDIKIGFLLCLLGSDRPINEVLYPNFQDQRSAMEKQFDGMSEIEFSYEDYEKTRENLVQIIHSSLTNEDKEFLLAFKNGEPDWSKYDFGKFPSVQWKLYNIQKLKSDNPKKHQELYIALKKKLEHR